MSAPAVPSVRIKVVAQIKKKFVKSIPSAKFTSDISRKKYPNVMHYYPELQAYIIEQLGPAILKNSRVQNNGYKTYIIPTLNRRLPTNNSVSMVKYIFAKLKTINVPLGWKHAVNNWYVVELSELTGANKDATLLIGSEVSNSHHVDDPIVRLGLNQFFKSSIIYFQFHIYNYAWKIGKVSRYLS